MERTLIILKPDCIQRRLLGRVLQRFEDKGLTVAGLKLMRIDRELAERHYAPHKGKPFYPPLIDYITSGPVAVLVLAGDGAIGMARKLMPSRVRSAATSVRATRITWYTAAILRNPRRLRSTSILSRKNCWTTKQPRTTGFSSLASPKRRFRNGVSIEAPAAGG